MDVIHDCDYHETQADDEPIKWLDEGEGSRRELEKDKADRQPPHEQYGDQSFHYRVLPRKGFVATAALPSVYEEREDGDHVIPSQELATMITVAPTADEVLALHRSVDQDVYKATDREPDQKSEKDEESLHIASIVSQNPLEGGGLLSKIKWG